MVMLPEARAPEGVRLYAIGDVHGCRDEFAALLALIDRDLARRAPRDWRLILLGDYVDRGPDSRGVLERVSRLIEEPRVVALRGNHDQYLLDFLDDPRAPSFDAWLFNGGDCTLASYGVELGETPLTGPTGRVDIWRALFDAMPAAERRLPERLALHARFGDYIFVHGGMRPGLPLERQAPRDLLWIRDEFLESQADFGGVVVHGHTVTPEVAVHWNRIGIDTGAVFGGRLTCLVMEGAERALLGERGLQPLPGPREVRVP